MPKANKPFAVFDIDGTVFRWQLYHELVFELIHQGVIPSAAQNEIETAQTLWQNRTSPEAFDNYEQQLVRTFERYLPGMPVATLQQVAKLVVERSGQRVYAYTRDLIDRLKKEQYILIALSGSFAEIVELFAKKHGFDIWTGLQYDHKDGVFTGTVNYVHTRKGALLTSLVERHKLSWEGSIGVGDGRGDGSMLELVEQPIAFNPSQALFDQAKQKHWPIVIERKNVIYQLQPDSKGSYILTQ